MLRENTPIERYVVEGKEIFVKREDLFGNYPAPPLSKLRGARIVLQNLKQQGITKIGVFDTRISKAGQGIAYLCKELELECLAGFPKLKGQDIAESHKIAESLGAKLYPLRAGRTAVCYAQFKKTVLEQNGYMLPLGLVCPETSHAVESISRAETERFNGDTICCCGADNIKGFENFWRYQSSQAAMIAKEKGQVSLEDMQQFWSGNNDEIQSGNILNNEMYMEVYGYQKGKAGENKEKAKANGNMLACQAGKMRDDAKTNNIRTTAKYCVDWMWNAGGANSPENDVNLKKSQDNGKLVYKWQDSVPMLENKQVKQGSLFDGF